MKRAIGLISAVFCSALMLSYPAKLDALELPRLDWEPRSDWLNVRQYGAKGDGKADDSAALQRAFDQVTNGSSIYLPEGTYRVTKTVTLTGPVTGVLVVGHGRDTTLVWDGSKGGRLLHDDGVSTSRYVGITFDGQGKAAVGFYHHSMNRFETEVLHQHLAFRNFTDAGLMAAKGDRYALAETTFDNCLFEDCHRGAVFTSFNDYNWTFDGCEFQECDLGIECRHGNFYARNCHFQDSRTVDILAQPEHGCSIRRCTSSGSQQFLDFANSVSPMTIQDCHIDGWHCPEGAVRLNGAPVILFDCSFSNPPNADAPVRALDGAQRLIVSENVAEGCENLVAGENQQFLYVVPPGERNGSLASAERSFFRETARIPAKVFDARRDFGAKGDRSADDTAAVQRTIDAARAHGRGAIAYLPAGSYKITKTLNVTGKDYYVGGSGFRTQMVWRGAEGGTMVAIRQPDHVTLQHIAIGNHDSGQMNNGIDVLQTGTLARSASEEPNAPSMARRAGVRGEATATHMTYDGVFVYGMYQKQPFRKGLHLSGLGPGETVVISGVQGNLRVMDSAAATILARTSFEGSVIVEGKDRRRDGFLGFLTRLSTITRHGLYVRDNHSVVMSDFYIEQADNGFVFEGSPGFPSGRITLQGGKLQFNVPKDRPTEGTAMTVRNYNGQIFFGHNQFYVEPPEVRISHTGTASTDLFVLGSLFYRTKLDVKGDKSLTVRLAGNQAIGEVTANGDVTYLKSTDTDPQEALPQLSRALDDLRLLGKIDLRLSHTEAVAH